MYDPQALRQGIEKAKQNIVMFEDAIRKENNTIIEYKLLIKELDAKSKIPKKVIVDSKKGK